MILCVGTSPAVARVMTFERLIPDTVNRAREVYVSAAGKAINAARVARQLGADVICSGILGGETGQFIQQELVHLRIESRFVISNSPTRVCVTLLDRQTRQTTELVQEAPPAEPKDRQQLLQILQTLLDRVSIVICSGTIAEGLGDDLYAEIVTLFHTRPVIVDAKGPPLKQAASRGAIIKCNRQEIVQTYDSNPDSAVRQSLQQGARAVIISDGPRPTVIATPEARWKIKSPPIDVVSPIGSGDALAGGLAVGLERGWSVPQAVRLGVACAASNAMQIRPGEINPSDVDQILPRLHICSIE